MRIFVVAFIAIMALAMAAQLAAAGPHAVASRSCAAPKYPGDGYFTSLSVKGVSCATGKKVTLAHYRCRIKHGKAGRCTKRVLGYSCTEKRQSIPTQIDSVVRCRNGSKRVTYSYQQNT